MADDSNENDAFAENNPSPDSSHHDLEEDEELATDEETAQYFTEVDGYDRWPEEVAVDFSRALTLAIVNSFRVDFASSVTEYRAIEADFLRRIGNHEENAQQVRRHITETILRCACDKDEPLDTRWNLWNDLLQLGFYRIEREIYITLPFARCCREHGEVDIGLSVIDPLIAKLEGLLADPAGKDGTMFFREHLDSLQKLRAKLEALRT